jgi:hypothetical protein
VKSELFGCVPVFGGRPQFWSAFRLLAIAYKQPFWGKFGILQNRNSAAADIFSRKPKCWKRVVGKESSLMKSVEKPVHILCFALAGIDGRNVLPWPVLVAESVLPWPVLVRVAEIIWLIRRALGSEFLRRLWAVVPDCMCY